jgi:hypothetical protein
MEFEVDPDLAYVDADPETGALPLGVERLRDPHQHSQV